MQKIVAALGVRVLMLPCSKSSVEMEMPLVKECAYTILVQYEQAQTELIGKAVVLSDGKAGTIDGLFLDELHGLRISVSGHAGQWPISTIKLIQN
ncbi:hypothetical protein V1279_006493 [Bradyrhizobium sp. AZCC 1610]